VVALEQKLKTAAESRAELSRLLAEAKAECAEQRGSASAATEALEEAFASARAVSGREASAREAQARAEARLAAAGAETAAAEERAARADDLEIRAQTAEARLESQARGGCQGGGAGAGGGERVARQGSAAGAGAGGCAGVGRYRREHRVQLRRHLIGV
jgi:membrane protein involved in colicin uptake